MRKGRLFLRRFGKSENLPYVCKTNQENDSDKRFGRLKNPPYLCKTKWSVRLVV